MMTEDERKRLDAKLSEIGVDRLLADQASTFSNTVGGPSYHRIYAGEWLSRETRRRRNTELALTQGKKGISQDVLTALHRLGNQRVQANTPFTNVVDDLDLEASVVVDALNYLTSEGLIEKSSFTGYSLTHSGLKAMENTRKNESLTTSDQAEVKERTKKLTDRGAQAVRNAVLLHIFETTEQGGQAFYDASVAPSMGMEHTVIDRAIEYLNQKGYFEEFGISALQLNAHGIDAAESLIAAKQGRSHSSGSHAPSGGLTIHTMNVSGGNVAVAQGHTINQSQQSVMNYPDEIKDLVAKLEALERGSLSPESSALLNALAEPKSPFSLAESIHVVSQKSPEHLKVVVPFFEGFSKKLGEVSAVASTTWLVAHGAMVAQAWEIVSNMLR